MAEEILLFDNQYWERKLGKHSPALTIDKRLHLVVSLIIFLNVSLAKLLFFIFNTEIKAVKTRAARFMGYTPTASDKDLTFPPGTLFRSWHSKFPGVRSHLHEIIKPCAKQMVEDESNRMIRDPGLQIRMKNLTLKGIQQLLEPQLILEKYQDLAPFTWDLLYTFTSLPNNYRRRHTEGERNSGVENSSDWEDDPNLADDDPEKGWMGVPPTPTGFSRNPVLVSNWWPYHTLAHSHIH